MGAPYEKQDKDNGKIVKKFMSERSPTKNVVKQRVAARKLVSRIAAVDAKYTESVKLQAN